MYIIYLKLYQAPLKKTEHKHTSYMQLPYSVDLRPSPRPYARHFQFWLRAAANVRGRRFPRCGGTPVLPGPTVPVMLGCPDPLGPAVPAMPERLDPSGAGGSRDAGAPRSLWGRRCISSVVFTAKVLFRLLIFMEMTCCEWRRVYGPLTNCKRRDSPALLLPAVNSKHQIETSKRQARTFPGPSLKHSNWKTLKCSDEFLPLLRVLHTIVIFMSKRKAKTCNTIFSRQK
nr:PREDICTED: uncharacterized protein LOC104138274 [Struthio camelus australis]